MKYLTLCFFLYFLSIKTEGMLWEYQDKIEGCLPKTICSKNCKLCSNASIAGFAQIEPVYKLKLL